jgi:hypothetical protein
VLAGCGGGGSGGSPSRSGSGSGGSDSGSGQTIATPASNVQTLTVDAGPASGVNIAFVSVTICAPHSTTSCQTIDHVQVDTGSYGLRILSSVLSASLTLPQETDSTGNPIVECTQFVDGYSWGPVKTADVHISAEVAANIPIQVIGDASFATVPTDCSSTGVPEDTVQSFGANGILGVGPFAEDCGATCVGTALPGGYYVCPSGGTCQATAVTLAQQVLNPVANFAADNNGVIVELPSVPASGAATVTGALVFGIGTQANNGLGSATVLTADPSSGYITTDYNGASYINSYIDSGSNANYFTDSSIVTCTSNTAAYGFFCPSATLSLSAMNTATNGINSAITFSVANADTVFTSNPTFTVFNNLAAPNADSTAFDLGLPFFLGRNVYTAIEGKNTSGGVGPYFAY